MPRKLLLLFFPGKKTTTLLKVFGWRARISDATPTGDSGKGLMGGSAVMCRSAFGLAEAMEGTVQNRDEKKISLISFGF